MDLAGVAGDSREHGLDDERSDDERVAMARALSVVPIVGLSGKT